MAKLSTFSINPGHFKQAVCSKYHVYYQKVYSSSLINHNFNIYTQTILFCTKIILLCNCLFFSLPRQPADYTITFPFNSLFSVPTKHNHASSIVRLYQRKENAQIFSLSRRYNPETQLCPTISHLPPEPDGMFPSL